MPRIQAWMLQTLFQASADQAVSLKLLLTIQTRPTRYESQSKATRPADMTNSRGRVSASLHEPECEHQWPGELEHTLLVVCGTLDHTCAAMHKAAHIGDLHELIDSESPSSD